MFAEASLQGTIVQRVWRYDDAAECNAQCSIAHCALSIVNGGHAGQRAGLLVSSGAG